MGANLLARPMGRASFTQALADEAVVRAMLEFERALAEAQAEAGVIAPDAARTIAAACGSLHPSPEQLAADGKRSGSLAVPLVKGLTDHVARHDARAAAFVHYGSTSQDVLDTALMLCLKPCLPETDRVLTASVAILPGHAATGTCVPLCRETGRAADRRGVVSRTVSMAARAWAVWRDGRTHPPVAYALHGRVLSTPPTPRTRSRSPWRDRERSDP
jgi:hypothetical protein